MPSVRHNCQTVRAQTDFQKQAVFLYLYIKIGTFSIHKKRIMYSVDYQQLIKDIPKPVVS